MTKSEITKLLTDTMAAMIASIPDDIEATDIATESTVENETVETVENVVETESTGEVETTPETTATNETVETVENVVETETTAQRIKVGADGNYYYE